MEEENINLKKRLPNGNDAIYWTQRISRQVPGASYTRTQFSIVPAFDTIIHKTQIATIDCVRIHLDNMPSHGQLYVAMSHVRKLEDLYFLDAETPLNVKRRFGVDIDAVEIIRKKKRIEALLLNKN
jgi:ATP-dependent exoDNAse (exonuclease V) alpha subunit